MQNELTAVPGLMPVHPASVHRPRLDMLSGLSRDRLKQLFTGADAPGDDSARALHGDQVLRGFAPVGGRVLNRVLTRPGFFWTGKSFRDLGDGTMLGHNFFQLAGGMRALPFVATVGESRTDGRPAVRIDYGHPRVANQGPSRWLYDEIREIEPGLWLGPGYLRRDRSLVNVCWFALDTTVEFDDLA
ncbi:hypothetical protein ACIRRA_45330 [Nocardia sp. NPDC101769]|uniref:hypothetical protein n=1 Tax=Nocardia sp. NPDC101769 TaxID=3364333 RepID=UPI003822B736